MKKCMWLIVCVGLVGCRAKTKAEDDAQDGNKITVLVNTAVLQPGQSILSIQDSPADLPNPGAGSPGALTGSTCKAFMPPTTQELFNDPNLSADANVPTTLSATGCTDPTNIKKRVSGTVPYNVRVPYWADGASRSRYIAMPQGGTMTYGARNHLDLPNGTVLVQNLDIDATRVETRLYVRNNDGVWRGYSYAWNDAQTDATLVSNDGVIKTLANGTAWNFQPRNNCDVCHNVAPDYTLGFQVAQLNTPATFTDGSTGNQLDAFTKLGVLNAPPAAVSTLPQLPDPVGGNVSINDRARTYLHVNCSSCHQPGGQGIGPPNFLISTPGSQLGVCNQAPSTGLQNFSGYVLLDPGAATQSVMSARMHNTSADVRMPAISSLVVDKAGSAAVDAWINALVTCPN